MTLLLKSRRMSFLCSIALQLAALVKVSVATDCIDLLYLKGRGPEGGPWTFESTKVIGYGHLVPANVGIPHANLSIALARCKINGFVFAVEGPVFVNQVITWCNRSADELEWFPFAPHEATCLPSGAKKLLLRRSDGVELGFETLLEEKLARLDFRPILTFGGVTSELLDPSHLELFRIMEFAAPRYYIERDDVNRTRRVVKIVPDFENKWKYFPAAIGCFSVLAGCILCSCIAETTMCRIKLFREHPA